MKKLLALLLALIMVLSLAACGEKESDEDHDSGEKKQTDPVKKEAGETIETDCWTLAYDPDIWSFEEDDLSDSEGYSSLVLEIPGESDYYEVSVEFTVSIEDPESYRDYLTNNEIDMYTYVVDNAYDHEKIGGVDCVKVETTCWDEDCLRYIGRDEASSATIFVEILGKCDDERVGQLLEGFTLNTEDIGNEDAPWPWEGEPFSTSDFSVKVEGTTVSSKWLAISPCIVTGETFNHSVAVAGDKAYILGDGVLRQYAFDGETLTHEKDISVSEEYTYVQATKDGTVWISGFLEPLAGYVDGEQTASYEETDYVTMHPSGNWGISWFSGAECEKFTVSNDSLEFSDITFGDVSTISMLLIDEDYIYVCGYAADDSGHKVFIYNLDGQLQMTLTDEENDSLGSVTFMAQTENGFIGLDGNMRDVVLWDKSGTCIGCIGDEDLFGTDYPWFCGGVKLENGSVLAVMTQDRADESAMELIAFVLSGF